MEVLSYWQRDFNTCGDCVYCSGLKVIDQRYPQGKQGFCQVHSKFVQNFPQTKCQQFCSKYDDLDDDGDYWYFNYHDYQE